MQSWPSWPAKAICRSVQVDNNGKCYRNVTQRVQQRPPVVCFPENYTLSCWLDITRVRPPACSTRATSTPGSRLVRQIL